jgi:Uma2 family endonuclease
MATATSPKTLDDLLAMEAKGIDCEIIRGELRIRGSTKDDESMTTRGYPHSRVKAKLAFLLYARLDQQPRPRGVVIVGEARVRIRRDPETIVGIDLAYIAPDLTAQTPDDATLIDGPPLLAVEIHSPSDTQEDILEKIHDYLDAGVLLVWSVEPVFRTITVYSPDAAPILFNDQQELTAEPHLPGFRVPVAEIFAS